MSYVVTNSSIDSMAPGVTSHHPDRMCNTACYWMIHKEVEESSGRLLCADFRNQPSTLGHMFAPAASVGIWPLCTKLLLLRVVEIRYHFQVYTRTVVSVFM